VGEMMSEIKFTESSLEKAIIERLEELGYDYAIDCEEWCLSRPLDSFINEELLLDRLSVINPGVKLPVLEQAISSLKNVDNPSLFERNHIIHKWLTDGIQIEDYESDVNPLVKFIDFKTIENNSFQVANQLKFKENRNLRIPDVIIFVNGIPLVVFELKSIEYNEDTFIERAYEQLGQNGESDGYRFDIPSYAVGLWDIGSYRDVDGCLKNLNVWHSADSNDWLSDLYTTGEYGLIKGTIANEWTSTTQPRETTINISGTTSSGKECQYSYTLRQTKALCDCNALTLDSTTASVDVGATTSVGFTPGCTIGHSLSTTDSSVATASFGTSNNIVITGHKAGTATIGIHYTAGDDTCQSGITVTVADPTPTCDCETANFQIDPTTMNRAYNDDNFYVQYTADCGSVSATVVSGSDWITGITVNNDDVTFDITENTSTTNTRSGSVKLFLVGNESCSASTTVTQGKAPVTCECTALTLNETAVTVTAGTSTSIGFNPRCTTPTRVSSSSAETATSSLDKGNNKVEITGVKAGLATVTLYYKAGTTDCSKTINVTVVCPNITINPDGGSCESSGGTQTFTINQ